MGRQQRGISYRERCVVVVLSTTILVTIIFGDKERSDKESPMLVTSEEEDRGSL